MMVSFSLALLLASLLLSETESKMVQVKLEHADSGLGSVVWCMAWATVLVIQCLEVRA